MNQLNIEATAVFTSLSLINFKMFFHFNGWRNFLFKITCYFVSNEKLSQTSNQLFDFELKFFLNIFLVFGHGFEYKN